VVGTGLDGGETLIEVPLGYTMSVDQQENGQLGSRIDGDTRIYTTNHLDNAATFAACLSGEQPDAYVPTSLKAPSGREITIEAWPDDPTWATEIGAQLDGVLSELEALVGAAIPGNGPIAIREVGAGSLGTYAGFFDPETGVARIGEDLQAKGLITHELSHAWFNGRLFQSTWLSEGYAEWARLEVDDGTCRTPGAYPGTGQPNIGQWQFAGPRATDQQVDVVHYQYAAACTVVAQVSAKIGAAGMRAALAALLDRQLAYRSGATVLQGPPVAATWQTWLDAIEELGGAPDDPAIEQSLVEYGIADAASLAKRRDARTAYHALVAALGDWTVPPLILRALANWEFDKAGPAIETAGKVRAAAIELSSVLPAVDGSAGMPRTRFEAATSQADLDAALAAVRDRLEVARLVAGASTALANSGDLVVQVGLLGTDLRPRLDAAVQAVRDDDIPAATSGAEAIQAALADAPIQGRLRLVVGLGLPVLLLLAFLVLRRRRRRRVVIAGSEPPDSGATAPPAT
jgi:hypothetical protein